jgi:hypothetical protein
VATDVLPLLHVPPVKASLNVMLVPEHNAALPVMAGSPYTVTTCVAIQPVLTW